MPSLQHLPAYAAAGLQLGGRETNMDPAQVVSVDLVSYSQQLQVLLNAVDCFPNVSTACRGGRLQRNAHLDLYACKTYNLQPANCSSHPQPAACHSL